MNLQEHFPVDAAVVIGKEGIPLRSYHSISHTPSRVQMLQILSPFHILYSPTKPGQGQTQNTPHASGIMFNTLEIILSARLLSPQLDSL